MAKAKILLVDDIPENIRALFNFLGRREFHVLVAQDGASALHIAENEHPDIIMLDVMMPGMDGFETCERLKRAPATREIPVIFMTALTETVDKIRGFELGAVDYISKPVHQEEILVRLNTHLSLSRLQRELRARNAQLDAFAQMLAQEMKSVLHAIGQNSQRLESEYATGLDEEGRKLAGALVGNARRAQEVSQALLLLAERSRHSELENLAG